MSKIYFVFVFLCQFSVLKESLFYFKCIILLQLKRQMIPNALFVFCLNDPKTICLKTFYHLNNFPSFYTTACTPYFLTNESTQLHKITHCLCVILETVKANKYSKFIHLCMCVDSTVLQKSQINLSQCLQRSVLLVYYSVYTPLILMRWTE